jgi:hypothetical protein
MPNSKPEEFKLGHYLSFRLFRDWCRFGGLFLPGVKSRKRGILSAKTWSERGDSCGGWGFFRW